MNAVLQSRTPPAEWCALRAWAYRQLVEAKLAGLPARVELIESLLSLMGSQREISRFHPAVGAVLWASCVKLAEKIGESSNG